jgi:hypothetical protein
MARRKPETLDDLLRPILDADRFTSWCEDVAGIRPWTMLRLRQGTGSRTHKGTILAIVAGLKAEGIEADADRVEAAIAASRAAAGK